MSVAVLNAMNTRGRAAICGAISHYNEVILMMLMLVLMLMVVMLMLVLMLMTAMVVMMQKLMKRKYIICWSVLENISFHFRIHHLNCIKLF